MQEPDPCPAKNHAVSGGGLAEHGWGQVRGGDESAHGGRSCWKEHLAPGAGVGAMRPAPMGVVGPDVILPKRGGPGAPWL